MSAKRREQTWIQCLNCGHIYIIERKVSIETSIIESECQKCGWHKGLNCGDKEEDIYNFYDPYLDKRFYSY